MALLTLVGNGLQLLSRGDSHLGGLSQHAALPGGHLGELSEGNSAGREKGDCVGLHSHPYECTGMFYAC